MVSSKCKIQFLIAVEDEVRQHFPALSPDTSGYTDDKLKHLAIESATLSENVKRSLPKRF